MKREQLTDCCLPSPQGRAKQEAEGQPQGVDGLLAPQQTNHQLTSELYNVSYRGYEAPHGGYEERAGHRGAVPVQDVVLSSLLDDPYLSLQLAGKSTAQVGQPPPPEPLPLGRLLTLLSAPGPGRLPWRWPEPAEAASQQQPGQPGPAGPGGAAPQQPRLRQQRRRSPARA